MTKHKDGSLIEAALTNVEVVADLATDNEAVRAIPIVGTAFKVWKGVNKPALLARVFVAHLDGVITGIELRRLASAIDSAFVEDINQLLVVSGLTTLTTGRTVDELGSAYYEISPPTPYEGRSAASLPPERLSCSGLAAGVSHVRLTPCRDVRRSFD